MDLNTQQAIIPCVPNTREAHILVCFTVRPAFLNLLHMFVFKSPIDYPVKPLKAEPSKYEKFKFLIPFEEN